MRDSLYEEQYKITKICIDDYKDCVLNGRMYQYNSEFGEGICFHSTMEFLKCMELVMRNKQFPNYQECRTFQAAEEMAWVQPSPALPKKGRMATFVIKILFVQHSSWQGTVLWCEGKKELCFRSVLELLLLLDSAVRA